MTERTRRLRMAMVGGAPGSFIGPVHRMAAGLDDRIQLVAGAFSSDGERSRAAGLRYGVDAGRAYADYRRLLDGECHREDGAEFVAIVTPNHRHAEIAVAALRAGLHVISDKPATATLGEALELEAVIRATSRVYALTYTYTGYPLVREARRICAAGELGAVRKVVVEYAQGWLSGPLEHQGNRQAEWRTNPACAGVGGCIGDIGVHAFNLLEYVSGRQVVDLCADLSRVVAGRVLDDDCNVLLRLDNGAPAVLLATQIAVGERNRLSLRVYGETGSLSWSHEDPNRLQVLRPAGRTETLHAGAGCLGHAARSGPRLPAGHPEGYIEAYANIYNDFVDAVARQPVTGADAPSIPGCDITAGVRGMRFIERSVACARERAGWTSLS